MSTGPQVEPGHEAARPRDAPGRQAARPRDAPGREAARPRVALVGALDTKHAEYDYLRRRLAAAGVGSCLVDVGVLGEPGTRADVSREAVAEAGGTPLTRLVEQGDRNAAMAVMAAGAARLVAAQVEGGELAGVLACGGSNAGFVMGRVSAALPIGVPKLLLSTIVAGDTRPYVGASDLTMMYPVVDIAGLNSISRGVLARAGDALAGMVLGPAVPGAGTEVEVVACTMFGVTTTGVQAVRDALEAAGREVHVFHATGVGGAGMEAMIRSGAFSAVADLTTTELVDDLVGGVCSAGPERLTAAARAGVAQVVSTGALDMANFGARETVPQRYADRLLHAHNPVVTLMRTDAEENTELGRRLAAKVNAASAPVEVHVPMGGFSQLSVPGAPFHDPVADAALLDSLRRHLDDRVPLHVHEADINHPQVAEQIVRALARVMNPDQKETP